jgi:phosphatidylserine synthase
MNFVFPILILINSDFKRISWILVMAGVVILAGHYIDFFNMVMPGTVGDRWFIGVSEIASVISFLVYLSLLCSRHWLNILCYQREILTSKRHFHY